MEMSEWVYIYAIEHPDGYYKVGRSKQPYDRASQIGVGSPYELTFRFALKYLTSRHKMDAERVMHDRLDDFNVGGEWFEANLSTVVRAFHSAMQSDEVEGHRVIDVQRRRHQENTIKHRHSRLNRRPEL